VSRDKLSSKEWIVTVDHKTIFNQQELDRNANVDPTQRPTRISGASRTIMIPVRACLRAGPYNTYPASPSFTMALARNSANDPLDPPIEVASTEWEIHCEKNVGSLPSWILTYGNGVNTADQVVTIMGTPVTIPKGCGKLSNLTFSDRKQENDIDFITLTWNVTVRVPRQKFATESQVPSPWDEERLDEGTKSYNTSTNAWDNFVDSNKHTTITTPIPLDGTGVPINTSGSPIAETAFQRYCYRPFPQVSYSVIPWA
jgi:hypothetical protein